jgi:hypothetical protein
MIGRAPIAGRPPDEEMPASGEWSSPSVCVCAVGVLTRLVWCGLLSVVSRWAPPAGAAARRVGGDVAPAGDGVSTGHGPGGDDARGDRPGRRAGQAERPCH